MRQRTLLYRRIAYWYQYRIKQNRNHLGELLIKNNQTRWLDLGSGASFKEGFLFADIMDESDLPDNMKGKYFKMDFSKPLNPDEISRLGKFDLVRMQHVFEHFTVEEGLIVLENCYTILNKGGYLLISVPDLEIFTNWYIKKLPTDLWGLEGLAEERFPADAPHSFYFSIYGHCMLWSQHQWCYDKEGLIYQIERSGKFSDVKRIGLFDKLCHFHFTHNRPFQDLCVLAVKA